MGEEIKLLVVDDDARIRSLVDKSLSGKGFSVTLAATAEEGREKLRAGGFEVVLHDLHLPGQQGLEALQELRQSPRPPEVVIFTGFPKVDSAVQAMKLGASDYITKPVKLLELEKTLRNAAERYRLQRENLVLRRIVSTAPFSTGRVVGESPQIRRVLKTVDRIANSEASVLLCGETGTGKGLIAKQIHGKSSRSGEAMMHLNCSAFNEQLLESELFGHERGAFTGAVIDKPGIFEVAHQGTLFLDEVAEMSAAMQAKLLQVLDNGEFRRVGGTVDHRVDVRIISATNKDLEAEVREGRFREDLLFRLNVVTLELPPLRQRKEDILGLAELYLKRFRLPGQEEKRLTGRALRALEQYDWPGNVRELSNVLEGAVLLAAGEEVDLPDLPPRVLAPREHREQEGGAPPPLSEVQRRHIVTTLDYTKGKKAPAARLLGVDIKTLNSKISKHGIKV